MWNTREQRRLVKFVRKILWHTWQQVKEGTGLHFSASTLKRIFEPSSITNWRAKQLPELSEEVAKLRFNWAKERLHMTKEDWHGIIWTDECSAECGKGKGNEFVFRTPQEK